MTSTRLGLFSDPLPPLSNSNSAVISKYIKDPLPPYLLIVDVIYEWPLRTMSKLFINCDNSGETEEVIALKNEII